MYPSLKCRRISGAAASAIWLLLCAGSLPAAPSIGSVAASAATVEQYSLLELTFGVTTEASNPYWPYDPSPAANTPDHPNAVPGGVGVSVDALFSDDEWQTETVQPAFYSHMLTDKDPQGNTQTSMTGIPWLYPTGSPGWRVRFTPTRPGQWHYRIRVTDASGTTTSPVSSFICTATEPGRGFVRAAAADSRYFELSDGTYLPQIGLAWDPSKTNDVETHCRKLKSMGVNLVRSWWQSSCPQLALFGTGGQGGDLVWRKLTYSTSYLHPGRIVNARVPIHTAAEPWNSLHQTVSVMPNRAYRLSATVKTVGVTGPADSGLRLDAWTSQTSQLFASESLKGSNDWQTLTVGFGTGSGDYFADIHVGLRNVVSGEAYCSEVSLREDLGNGNFGPELVMRSDFQAHNAYPQPIASRIDQLLTSAEANGIYVRAVISEKEDAFFSCISEDGTWSDYTANNVYAGPTHASRVFQQYYWRYLIARYGYSTALHSVEFVNEGDPFSGPHIHAVSALGEYFKEHDPNQHLVSTSNWHSFPPDMWTRSELGVADLHMYLGWGVASGGNRLWPGWDGTWTQPTWLDFSEIGSLLSVDSTTSHSGSAALRIDVPVAPGPDQDFDTGNIRFQCGVVSGHTVRVSAWCKAQNLRPSAAWKHTGLGLLYSLGGGDSYGSPVDNYNFPTPNGTYDWQLVETEFVVPSISGGRLLLEVNTRIYKNDPSLTSLPGVLWLDDITVTDVTSGIKLNYGGGFENWIPVSYDIVAGHCAYSTLTRSFQYGKPTVRGEIGICKPGSPEGEDSNLEKDTSGVWWKKLVWSHIHHGGLVEIYWWDASVVSKGFTHAKAFQTFMSGIPLSNGHYRDVEASVSNAVLRVLGQKDPTNNRAHLWIDNASYTWKAVVDHNYAPEQWSSTATYMADSTCGAGTPTRIYKSLQNNNINHPVTDAAWWQDMGVYNAADNPPLPAPVSGTITVSGLANGDYRVEWWNTATGEITSTQNLVCSGGNLTLSVSGLVSDTACKIYPSAAQILLTVNVPQTNPAPNDEVTITVGYTNAGNAPASNVAVRALVPDQMAYVAGSAEATGGVYNSSQQYVTWTVPSVAAGESGTRTFRARVK